MASKNIACNNCGSMKHFTLLKFKWGKDYDFLDRYLNVVICKECSLCFLNPQHTPEDYAKYYARNDNKPTPTKEWVLRNRGYQYYYAKWLCENCGLPGNARILDFGCGVGAFLYFLRELGYKNVFGLDISERNCRTAEEVMGIKASKGDFLDNDLPSESFDMVTATRVIEHMTDPLFAIKEISRVLKPGGLIYLNTPDLENFSLRKWFFKFVHTFYFTKLTLTSLLKQAGFEVVKILQMPSLTRYSNFLFPENCVHSELNIIAKKTLNSDVSPLKEDYRRIVCLYKDVMSRDFFYSSVSKLILSKYDFPVRMLRKIFWKYRKDRMEEFKNFFLKHLRQHTLNHCT